MLVGFNPISLGETARSISKARMSVKRRALVLIHRQRTFKKILENTMPMDMTSGINKTHSTSENRKPIQARGPPINDNTFAQTPGTEEAAFGIFAQRSGLEKKKKTGWITK